MGVVYTKLSHLTPIIKIVCLKSQKCFKVRIQMKWMEVITHKQIHKQIYDTFLKAPK